MAKKLTKTKARQILHDKEVHGHALTDKQRRFFGAIAGGAKPYKAQNGIEGTMGGLTDKGFDFNPAWGGAWRDGGMLQPPMAGANQVVPMYAMGGNLPGSVGFTYARTQGAAPSEGPYAKKTLPSAQNGMEMKFYQEGLDFKPKTISRNGGWLDKYDNVPKAQFGGNISSTITGTTDLGEGLLEILSFPQKGIVKLITGKYQTPSEAMGIKSGVGSFLVNAVLDPVNLLGAGLAGKAAKAPNAVQKIIPKPPTGINHLKELIRMKNEGVDLVKFFSDLDWTPEGQELWKEMKKYKVKTLTGGRELRTDNIGEGKRAWAKKNLGQELDDVIVEKQKEKYASPTSILVDDLESNVKKFREAGGNAILHVNKEQTLKELRKHMAKNPDHLIYTDLDGVLVDLIGGVGKFRKKKNGGAIEGTMGGLSYYSGNENIPAVIKNKGEYIPKKNDGGEVVKDNDGYWNPENWGKVVEIDSPYITMQGVDQPLIGISDTGDIQYMEPGEDYVFDGESVTEYPVAAQGVSVNKADEYPLHKLDDLFNFSNYNKPKAKNGKWLDKYK